MHLQGTESCIMNIPNAQLHTLEPERYLLLSGNVSVCFSTIMAVFLCLPVLCTQVHMLYCDSGIHQFINNVSILLDPPLPALTVLAFSLTHYYTLPDLHEPG
jgi:hypothetical protein